MSFVFSHVENYAYNSSGENYQTDQLNLSTEDEDDTDAFCVVYSLILPLICISGVVGNILSFLVLLRIPCKCSSYTYLTVKAASDTANCFLLLMSVIAHGFFYDMDGEDFDLLITLPVASIFSGISVCATVGVTIDRLLYLWNPICPVKPAYCRPYVARRIMAAAILFSIILNLPYFFIFTLRDDGNLNATKFFKSRIYTIYNWVRLMIFGIIPCITLIITTGLLIFCIHKISRTLRHLSVKRQKDLLDPSRMTWTLMTIIVLFLLGEVPGHIVSKKAAFVFLYSGDFNMVAEDDDKLDTFRQITLVLGTINCSCNFLVFYMLHPPFGKGLKQLFSRKPRIKKHKPVLVKIFFITDREQISTKPIRHVSSEFSTWLSR